MTRIRMMVLAFVLGMGAVPAAPAVEGPPTAGVVELWPDGAPHAQGDEPADRPVLRIFLPEDPDATEAGVIVCPGGGYRIVAIDHEGIQVARRLNERGIAAFVLTYRLKPTYSPEHALLDAQRAVRYVRHHAEAFGVAPERIGVLGFSAGGHLTTAVGTRIDAGDPEAADPIDRASSRPSFLAPCYPVVSGELRPGSDYDSTDRLVTAETPPTFLFHTAEDSGVPAEHSLRFFQALREHGVPAELHVFGRGPHGIGLGSGDPRAGGWLDLFTIWLRDEALLTTAPRVEVAGTLTIDGEPMHRGWITLLPVGPDASKRPVAALYASRNAEGAFRFDAEHGPVPGRYRVEVRRVAKATDPEPSVEDETVWDAGEIEVRSDRPNRFTFEIKTDAETAGGR